MPASPRTGGRGKLRLSSEYEKRVVRGEAGYSDLMYGEGLFFDLLYILKCTVNVQ
jgi:hypothetical protein